jgi:hypothetical protein
MASLDVLVADVSRWRADMGRKAHLPDPTSRRQVEAMAAYGVPEADIATVIGIDPKTLRKHYRQELNTGGIKANSKVAESLYKKALGDGAQSVTAAIFWLKTRAQWKETVVNEVTHSVADPIRAMMQRIADRGNRVHDRVVDITPNPIEETRPPDESARDQLPTLRVVA